MTQFPHDEFAKNFLDSLLSPLGTVEVSQQISSEVRYADVYFTPQAIDRFYQFDLDNNGCLRSVPRAIDYQ